MRINQLCCFLFSVCLVALFSTSAANAKNNVVVVPLGNGSELKPIKLNDVLVNRMFFNQVGQVRDLFITDETYSYVVTSMHVYFDSGNFPSTRRNVGVRTRTPGQLIKIWYVPNDEYSVIDFGSGYLFQTSSRREWQIDIPYRGGYGTGSSNTIHVDFYGYRVRK